MVTIALNSYCFTPQYSESVEYDDDEDEDYYSADGDSDSDDDEYVLTQEEPKDYPEKYNEVAELREWIVDSNIYQTHADKLLHILLRRLLPD